MPRSYKGEVHYIGDRKMICGGAYWDWPWWKRTLSTIAHPVYVRWRFLRALWRWHTSKRTRSVGLPGRQMPKDAFLKTCQSLASSRIKPIWWQMESLEALDA